MTETLKSRAAAAGASVLRYGTAETALQFARAPSDAQLDALDGLFSQDPTMWLRVYGHGLTDHLDFLPRLPSVRRVRLDHGPLRDWRGLSSLSPALRELALGDALGLAPLDVIATFTSLTSLSIECKTSARALPRLAALTSLQRLVLGGASLPARTLDALARAFTVMHSIDLRRSRIERLDALATMPALRSLAVHGGAGALDLAPLGEAPQLDALAVGARAVVGVERLSSLRSLGSLSLSSCKGVVSLDAVASLASLRSLGAHKLDGLAALPSLARCEALRSVSLSSLRDLRDLSALASAPALTSLAVRDCPRLTPAHFEPLRARGLLRAVDYRGARSADVAAVRAMFAGV